MSKTTKNQNIRGNFPSFSLPIFYIQALLIWFHLLYRNLYVTTLILISIQNEQAIKDEVRSTPSAHRGWLPRVLPPSAQGAISTPKDCHLSRWKPRRKSLPAPPPPSTVPPRDWLTENEAGQSNESMYAPRQPTLPNTISSAKNRLLSRNSKVHEAAWLSTMPDLRYWSAPP